MSNTVPPQPADDLSGSSARSGRTQLLGFVTDAETEAVVRQGLVAAETDDVVLHRGNIRHAIATMKKTPSPRVLLVDISEDEQPVSSLMTLSEVVEPDVRVLVIGDRGDLNLYRQLTRTLGVTEYLYKPVTAEIIAQHFGPYVTSHGVVAKHTHGARLLTVTGVCGGVGATTIAANLGWSLANDVKRHTLLLDANLQTGSVAMLLGAKIGGGLRLALETPSRIDDVFVERMAEGLGDRLAVIAAEEKLTDPPLVVPGAIQKVMNILRLRYNYIVVDMPLQTADWHGELLDMTRQRILVMQPTLPAVRDVLRALALPMGPQQIRRPLIVLNNLGAPGTMTRQEVETALQEKVSITIPHLPRAVNSAAILAKPVAEARGAYRNAMRALLREVAAAPVTQARQWRGWPLRRGARR